MSDNNDGNQKLPHVSEVLKNSRNVWKYMLVYAVLSLVILSLYDSEWLAMILLAGFAGIAYNRINTIFSGSDWTPRDKDSWSIETSLRRRLKAGALRAALSGLGQLESITYAWAYDVLVLAFMAWYPQHYGGGPLLRRLCESREVRT